MPRKFLGLMVWVGFVSVAYAAAGEEVDYYAVLADGAKIGHSIHTRRVRDGEVVTTSVVSMSTDRLGVSMTVTVTQENVETLDGRPLAFKSVQDISVMSQVMEGKITPDGKVTITTGEGEKQTMDWPPGALLSEGVRLLQKRHGLKEGTTYSFVMFEPSSLRGLETTVRVVGRKSVDVLGRQEALWELQTQTDGITATTYVDDDLKERKSLMAEIGMDLQIVACTKEFALGENASVDLISRTLLDSPRPLNDLAGAGSVAYRLVPKSGAKLRVPSYDNQKVTADPSGLAVTVKAQKVPTGVVFPYSGDDANALEAMKPSMYLDSQKPEVAALARQAVGTTKDAAQAVRRIESFVRNYITSKDYAVGYAPAGEVVQTRQGDCTEHAVLAAAMCRAVGIPARMAVGMVYLEELEGRRHIFGPHAWIMVYLDGRWFHFDPTLPRGYDLGHVALAAGDGNPADYLNMASVLGAFRMEAVTVQPKSSTTGPAKRQKSSLD